MTDATRPAPPADPTALRALAHPVRWKLIDVLDREGTATATRCSELLGESTATCSYHLGILAKYGYITRVAGREWRDKPWRLVRPDLDLSASGLGREWAAASRAVAATFLDDEMTRMKESVRRSADEPEQWQHVNKIMGATTWLTAAESQRFTAEVLEVLDKYAGSGGEDRERPEGARQVRLFAAITLTPPSPEPGDQ